MGIRKVPELSLNGYISGTKAERQRFIDDFFVGLKDYGFIVLKDHPIPVELLNKAYELVARLFALPEATKMTYALPNEGFQRGYTPFGKEHAKNSKVHDLKEFWHVGRELKADHRFFASYPRNIWPAEIAEFEPTMKKIYSALDETGQIMLEALTLPLELPPDFSERERMPVTRFSACFTIHRSQRVRIRDVCGPRLMRISISLRFW